MTVTQQISPPEHEAMGHMAEASSEGKPLELDGPPPEDEYPFRGWIERVRRVVGIGRA